MKNIAPKILTALAMIIFVFAIIIMISGTVAIRQNKPVFIMGYALAVVPTDSMVGENEDSLDPNDLVIIKKIDISDVKVDEHPVIVYQGIGNDDSDILIIHRVVDQTNEGLVTQGDNEETNDYLDQSVRGGQDYITADNFQGIYVTKITFLKPIASLMTSSRNVIFAIIVFILVMILFTELIHILKTVNDKKKTEMAQQHQAYLEMMKQQKAAMTEDIHNHRQT